MPTLDRPRCQFPWAVGAGPAASLVAFTLELRLERHSHEARGQDRLKMSVRSIPLGSKPFIPYFMKKSDGPLQV
jgi:hypothetical protein